MTEPIQRLQVLLHVATDYVLHSIEVSKRLGEFSALDLPQTILHEGVAYLRGDLMSAIDASGTQYNAFDYHPIKTAIAK